MIVQRPNSPTLCAQCTPLIPLLVDISTASKSNAVHSKWWNETYGKAMNGIRGLVTETCELCSILHRRFSQVPGFDPTTTRIDVSDRGFSSHKGVRHSGCTFEACGARLALAPVTPVVQTDDGEELCAFIGRPVMPTVIPLLPRIWMARCEEHPACKPDYCSKDFDFPFRLIDVKERRLVDAPPDARYVALSYVWGGVKQVMLKKSNKQYLELEGSITPDGLREPEGEFARVGETMRAEGRVIPRTIREAILLCQQINERYLWTDSLCILQDDEFQRIDGAWTNADKVAQIPKMDIIYGASTLTVIAACGDDSDAGLPGVHPTNTRTTQIIGQIGDQMFVSVSEDPMKSFWKATWCQRAWTFQEFLLSKRHMIFLPEQIVFHCSTTAYCEDHSLEFIDNPHEHTNSVPAWTQSYTLRPFQLPARSRWGEDIFFPEIFINQYYSSWLKNFLKRRLTVATDILSAFEGAQSASTVYLGLFHHGLSVDYFSESLLWGVGTSSLYTGKDPCQGLIRRRDGFPSWSWIGWMWDVTEHEEFHVYYNGKRSEHWRRVAIWGTRISEDREIELWKISSPGTEGWEKFDFLQGHKLQKDDHLNASDLTASLDKIKALQLPLNCLVLETVKSFIFVGSKRQNQYSSPTTVRCFSSPDLIDKNLIGGIDLPRKDLESAKGGLRLQILLTGSWFNGPDPKFPDQTDKHDPTINCLVVNEVEEGVYERLNRFSARSSKMKNLEWEPLVAVLQ